MKKTFLLGIWWFLFRQKVWWNHLWDLRPLGFLLNSLWSEQISCRALSCLPLPKVLFTWGKHHEKCGFLAWVQIPVFSIGEPHKVLNHSRNNFSCYISKVLGRSITTDISTLVSIAIFFFSIPSPCNFCLFVCFYGEFSQDLHWHRVSCRKEKSVWFTYYQHYPLFRAFPWQQLTVALNTATRRQMDLPHPSRRLKHSQNLQMCA